MRRDVGEIVPAAADTPEVPQAQGDAALAAAVGLIPPIGLGATAEGGTVVTGPW